MPQHYTEHRVASDGVTLAVREHTPSVPGRAHLVLVHGYPDSQSMWRPVVEALVTGHPELQSGDGPPHVVTYDVRGAGASDAPEGVAGYRAEHLVEDLVAVVRATVPDAEPVHLVGHDWGSVQLWEAVAAEGSDPRLRGRIASFTSISGPSLDHVAHLSRHPGGRRLRLLNQSARSWYVYAFQVPVLPELAWTAAGQIGGRLHLGHWGPELSRNARNGLNLYRANVMRPIRQPGELRTDVPVLVVQPTRDRFVTDVLVEDLDRSCSRLSVVRMDAGHWLPRSHPRELAALVTEHIASTRVG